MVQHADIDHTGVTGAGAAAHIADTDDAHDASAISFTPAGTIAATDVQAAIEEVASEAGGGAAPDCYESVLTTDVVMTNAATWYDSGLSLSLAAGTWLVSGQVMVRVGNSGATFVGARVCDSSAATVYWNGGENRTANGGQECMIDFTKRITLGGTTTVKVQCIDSIRALSEIKADPVEGSIADNIVSVMTALSVTSA
jgi:hypothetical protein